MASSSSTPTNNPPSPPPPPSPRTASTEQQDALSLESDSNPIGYCHTCDRQVEIDKVNFVCTHCNGGFIELFEIPPANSNTDNDDGQINIQINEGVSSIY